MIDALSQEAMHLWSQETQTLDWHTQPKQTFTSSLPFAHWFDDGMLNASYMCLDWQIKKGNGDKPALIWESETGDTAQYTYHQLLTKVSQCAHGLSILGVKKGDVVIIYMPMIPESVIAMLACARLGATHSVVFSGYSSTALRERIEDTGAQYIITADVGVRRGKKILLKKAVDEAINDLTTIKKVIVAKREMESPITNNSRDITFDDLFTQYKGTIDAVPVESNHPLFILYTSGTTGKPKGIIHSTGGYLTYCHATFKWTFDPQPLDVYWCTADIGWITGHSYVVYAPLTAGTTVFMFEGAPDYPNPGIWWSLIEKHAITLFYTAPTAIRMAIKEGNEWPERYNLSSLRRLGTVGEPINPDVWEWYKHHIGHDKCLIIDTFWQTETGGFMIAPSIKNNFKQKAGSVTSPLPGIKADVVDEEGKTVSANKRGHLVFKQPWPGMALGIYGDQERFIKIYLSPFPSYYYTGDYAQRDAEGDYWILGRADEVLNIAGHRVGTAEVENAVLQHPAVAEAAVIGTTDTIRGQALILFATLKHEFQASTSLKQEIAHTIKSQIGSFVQPKEILFVEKLPKTRSGKIMRRVLKGVIENTALGDLTTLENEGSIEEISTQYHILKQSLTNHH